MKKLHLYAVAEYSEKSGNWCVLAATACHTRAWASVTKRDMKQPGVKQKLRIVKLKEVVER